MCFFEVFHDNNANIEGFLFVLIIIRLPLFVYFVLFKIAVITEIQGNIQPNMVLCRMLSTFAWQVLLSIVSCREFSYYGS